MSDVGPACFIWLNVFHRFTVVQSVTHPVTCNVCQRTNFNGFRYKCQKCRKYQLCQDCFWRGRVSHSHQLTHQMKEYTSYVGIFSCCLIFSLSLIFFLLRLFYKEISCQTVFKFTKEVIFLQAKQTSSKTKVAVQI